MIEGVDGARVARPLFQAEDGGSIPTSTLQPRELVVSPCSLDYVRAFVEQHHYSHSVSGVKVSCCFQVRARHQLVGAAVFGEMSTSAWRAFGKSEREVLELRRFVLSDAPMKNSETRVLGWMLRWLRKHATNVNVVVSYADPAYQHEGTIYRAAGFVYDGITPSDSGFRDPDTGRIYHSRALRTKYSGRYKPFVRQLRAKQDAGVLECIDLPGKHRYIFPLRGIGDD